MWCQFQITSNPIKILLTVFFQKLNWKYTLFGKSLLITIQMCKLMQYFSKNSFSGSHKKINLKAIFKLLGILVKFSDMLEIRRVNAQLVQNCLIVTE